MSSLRGLRISYLQKVEVDQKRQIQVQEGDVVGIFFPRHLKDRTQRYGVVAYANQLLHVRYSLHFYLADYSIRKVHLDLRFSELFGPKHLKCI